MFLVGIAGPFIPYFLLMGFLLVFTLETSRDFLPKAEEGPAGSKIHLLTEEKGFSGTAGCYHFNTHDSQKIGKKQLHKNFSLLKRYFQIPLQESQEIILQKHDNFLSSECNTCYFGLPPPFPA